MNSYFKKMNVDWLLENDNTSTIFNGEAGEEIIEFPIPPELGWVKANMLKLSRSISVYNATHYFSTEASGPSLTFGKASMAFEESTFSAHTVNKTTIRYCGNPSEQGVITQPNLASFYHCKNIDIQPIFETGTEFTAVNIAISLSAVDLLIGQDNRAALLKAINIEALSSQATHPINYQIRKTLLESNNPRLQGQMKLLYAESKVLEFICLLQEFVGKHSQSSVSTKQSVNTAYELHDYLCNLKGALPSAEIIAKDFNMSSRNLNRVFANEFGVPIHTFITKHRLQEAHVAIENSDVSQKQIANSLGYSHVNSFIAAFRREFNYPPGFLRK